MELYINSTWTQRYENAYIAEAIAWSENGNQKRRFQNTKRPELRFRAQLCEGVSDVCFEWTTSG
jgi:hypothetical protein